MYFTGTKILLCFRNLYICYGSLIDIKVTIQILYLWFTVHKSQDIKLVGCTRSSTVKCASSWGKMCLFGCSKDTLLSLFCFLKDRQLTQSKVKEHYFFLHKFWTIFE